MWKIISQNVPFVFGRFVQYVEDNLSERTVCILELPVRLLFGPDHVTWEAVTGGCASTVAVIWTLWPTRPTTSFLVLELD